ncbi:tetraacyldisaccharide 4'-kinase [Candidatus Palauibacter sp.]|uniref:tetraacyldisaccharide 4'-kinase n=1 Tax=Candidatus Palauibacter sp. TaxID=3101350 RepID=UPI003B01B210
MNARRIPVGAAVGLLRTVLPVCRTWRFRHPDDPGRPYRPVLAHEIHACWHEHLLPLAWLFAGQNVATLASRDRDGEIISRLLRRMGYDVARGSSTRGGQTGFRQLARSLEGGLGVILTGDGPRGPRRSLKEGTARLADHGRSAASVVGVAASAGWRLSSWDRFLIPAPGATVFVSLASAGPVARVNRAQIEAALDREVARCEQAAREMRWARPPRIVRPGLVDGRTDPVRGARGSRRAGTAASALENRIRAAWRRARPNPALGAAARVFGFAHDARHRLYDLRLLAVRGAGIPVISVGGVTAGGSGKTPLSALIARTLGEAGHRPAILAGGYADELALLADETEGTSIWGHPDRVRTARRARAEGATVAILDDGFQHRRLRRDLDVLLLDRDALRRTNGARLPAGPFRERWEWAVSRADAIISTGREPWTADVARFDRDLRDRLDALAPGVPTASAAFGTGPPRPANESAHDWDGSPAPGLALTGIMKPNLFFARACARCPSVREKRALGDHGVPGPGERATLVRAAGPGGILTTRKDLHRLRPFLGAGPPIWVLPETIIWKAGWEEVRGVILQVASSRATLEPDNGAS